MQNTLKETRRELYTTREEILEAVKENRKPRIVGLTNIVRYLFDTFEIKLTKQAIAKKLKRIKVDKDEGHYKYKLTEQEIIKIFRKSKIS